MKTAVVAETLRKLGLLECLACLFQVGFKDVTVKSAIKSSLPSFPLLLSCALLCSVASAPAVF